MLQIVYNHENKDYILCLVFDDRKDTTVYEEIVKNEIGKDDPHVLE
jgi:hypothetical protein